MKLIKVDGYWIILSDEEIKENDWYLCWETINGVSQNHLIDNKLLHSFCIGADNYKKIIFSQNPEHNLPSITFSDEVGKELGVFNIVNLSKNYTLFLKKDHTDYDLFQRRLGFYDGYNQALSDNKDKLFTLKQMESCFFNGGGFKTFEEFNFYIQHITKKEYDCELEMYEPIKNSPSGVDRFVKITNNSVKVIKIIK